MKNVKPKRYCGRCRCVHDGECEQRNKWQNRRGSGRGGRAWGRKRKRIFERDSFMCQRCLRKGRFVFVELHGPKHGILDHITALAEGGTDDDSNLETLCQACNKEKTAIESARAQGRGYQISE